MSGHVQLPSFRSFISGIENSGGASARPSSAQVNHPEPLNGSLPSYLQSYRDSPNLHYYRQNDISPERARTSPITGVRSDLPPLNVSAEQNGRERDLGVPLAAAPILHNRSQSMTNQIRPSLTPGSRSPSHTKTVVDETNIAGKGLCYVYDDGTICQKTINGDAVNPKWGTTKAGKPRKRLGQACNTCREKKIRCDPQIPKCAQCQKFGRECKFESRLVLYDREGNITDTRSQRSSYKTTSSNSPRDSLNSEGGKDTGHDRNGSSGSAETSAGWTKSREDSRSSMQLENLLSPSAVESSPSEGRPPSKRQKMSTSPQDLSNTMSLALGSPRPPSDAVSPAPISPTGFCLENDPSTISSSLTNKYLELFFSSRNRKIYHLFPRSAFMKWVFEDRQKSLSDNMVLYALLASGSLLSSNKDRDSHHRHFVEIAERGLESLSSTPSLQRVHTLVALALLPSAAADSIRTFRLWGSAVQTTYDLGLFNEEQLAHSRQQDMTYYGLNTSCTNELKRRTFWLAYVVDNIKPCFRPGKRCLGYDHCLLRLPCDDDSYENGFVPETPFYRGHLDTNMNFHTGFNIGEGAYLVEIATIVYKILTFPADTEQMSPPEWREAYESFYKDVKHRLLEWDRKITQHYSRTKPSNKRSRGNQSWDHAGLGLRVLHSHATMLLNRVARHRDMLPEHIERNCREAHHSAIRLLELMRDIRNDGINDALEPDFARCSPFTGFVVFMAVDIITAAATKSSLLEQERPWMEIGSHLSFTELLSIGQGALETLSHSWETASSQLELVKKRFITILNGTRSDKVAFYFSEPLGDMFGLGQDVVYGTSRLAFLTAIGFGEKVKSESDLFEMSGTN